MTRRKRPAAAGAGVARPAFPPPLDPIITMNAGGFIQSASESVEQVFGWTAVELLGQNVKVLVPEPRRSALDRYLDRYRHADKSASLQRTRRFAGVRKDGTPIQVELSMSRAELPTHDAKYFIGIFRDVTNQIDTSADTSVEQSRMQNLITEQTRALATANLRLQLSDRLASLGTLAAGLGHDMNNVLLPVRARLNALDHAGLAPAASRHIKALRRSIAYLQHLSDGLYLLAQSPESPRFAPEGEEHTNLADWWARMGPLLRKALPPHVKLQVTLPRGLPEVRIAQHWLTQALLNLIVNAGEAVSRGQKNASVRLRAQAVGTGREAAVRVSVSDNGRGMSPAIQRRAFDPFFTTKAREMGTGLGLPLVRNVASRAGGNVEISSRLGHGTTVDLMLRAAGARARKKGAAGASQRTAALSIADHRTAALVTQILLGAGVRVCEGNGATPGNADMWITRPSRGLLADAQRWHNRADGRAIVLLGDPSGPTRDQWLRLGASIIEMPTDFETMRHTIVQAAQGRTKTSIAKEDA